MDMDMNRISKSGIMISVILLFALLVGGCYWTPEQDEGGVTLNIDGSEIGASAINGFNGFFLGYVIAGDLLSGDAAAADQAFEEVGNAIDQAFSTISSEEDLSDFELYLTFPAVQLQAEYFVEPSGSNTFGGLRAGREYLVVVFAVDFNNSSQTYLGDMGFTAVTIEGGEAKSVNLELGNNWARFYEFMERRYGYAAETGAVEITMPNTYTGLHIDLLTGSSPDPSSPQFFDTWYLSTDVVVVNRDNDPIQKSGNRPGIPSGLVTYRIEAVAPNRAWRVLVTTWQERSPTTNYTDYYLSTPITTTEGGTTYLDFSQFGSGDDFNQYYVSQ